MKIIDRVKLECLHGLMLACRVFPIDRNKVVIMNYNGKGFGDHGKAIALKLMEKAPQLDIVWVTAGETDETLPTGIRSTKFCSPAYYREMATAGVWVDNCRKGAEILKRKGQYYIQTWHGMVALKRIEKDAEGSLSERYVKDSRHDSRMADVILSGCSFFTDLCRRAFWYDGEILECGSPRLDVLFDESEEKIRSVKERLGIRPDCKVVLYAPTFRADMSTDCYIQNYEEILDALEAKTGEKWAFAVRLHPNVSDRADFLTYNDRVVNATTYPDLYELIPASDLVITDYSSVMFDASLIGKSVVLYAKDIESYTQDRNFYFDLQELPFPLTRTQEELTGALTGFDRESYLPRLEQFNSSLGYCETGRAAEAVADRILKVLSR